MNRIAIAFSTCDRTELTKRSIEPLLQPDKFDLWWNDGSKTDEGKKFAGFYANDEAIKNSVYGGSGPAIVYALTKMLAENYEGTPIGRQNKITGEIEVIKKGELIKFPKYHYIGLVENDVLLDKDWFEPTMQLFEIGKHIGLEVGAVSARCYEDRILFQCGGYAVCHNLGAGMIIFSRKAAELVLQHYRTVWTTENRLLFVQLSGIDIGSYWAFRGNEHFLVADWNFDRVLAAHGLASLALTPNKATMLDQDIAPLGLKYADGNPPDAIAWDNTPAFVKYRNNLALIKGGTLCPGTNEPFFRDEQGFTIFPHQVPQIGGVYSGDWRIRDFLGFGPFCWKSGKPVETETAFERPSLIVPLSGPAALIVSGGRIGGSIRVEDEQSGFKAEPALPPENDGANVLQIPIPSACGYRPIKLTALSEGICFLGIKTLQPQPWLPHVKFDYSTLPPA
jgi:hypothetical protein